MAVPVRPFTIVWAFFVTLIVLALLAAVVPFLLPVFIIFALGAAVPLALFLLIVIPSAVVHFARGARNMDEGIPCTKCKGRAFPIDETRTSYRCILCRERLEGPRHI
jgi:hypothetical protein